MMEEDKEEVSFVPPDPLTVARRALILSGVVCRANLEYGTDKAYCQQTVEDTFAWFDDLDLWPYLEPDEGEILHAPLGQLSRNLSVRGTWFVEGLAILAWALRRSDFPPHDRKVSGIKVTNALDFLAPDAEELLASPTRREAAELEAAREWFYDVHCTLRGFLHHGGDGHLATWIGDYLTILGIEQSAVGVKGILAFKGIPLPDADRKELNDWEQVVCERHRAAIWLAGEEPLFTELSVDT